MSGLRVLVLNHAAVPRDQPGGTRHIELFSRLDNWNFTIIAGRRNIATRCKQPDSPKFAFVPVIRHHSNGISRILSWCSYALMALLAGMRTPRPDVVYASSPHMLTGLTGWILARHYRARFVLEIRDLWPQTLVDMGHLSQSSMTYRILRALELFLYQRADRIVAMAPGTVDAIVRAGSAKERIAYLPNAADPEDFATSVDRETLRQRYGFTRLTGVYAGAHGPANGLHLLLQAAADVRELELDIVLVGDGVSKADLRRSASALNLRNVKFMDPVSKSEIPDLLAAADFGIHVLTDADLFQSAVSPNKIFDYLAAGLPIVTNCPGVVGSVVCNAKAGYVCEPSRLAEPLVKLASLNAAERQTLGANGRRWLKKHNGRKQIAERLNELLEVVGGATSHPAERRF